MLQTAGISLQIGKEMLFEDVNIKFTNGNCYGLIGANGAGKSTFLKILAGRIEPTRGQVVFPHDKRMSFLEQNHYLYDENEVLETVIMGNMKLYNIMQEKNAIYMKEDFTEEDGIRAGDLEALFDDMNGWNAESDAAMLLTGLGIDVSLHNLKMKELNGNQKVKVLLAKALFGNPDVLLLDEPTNHLDHEAILWLEEYLANFENTIIVVSHDRYFLNKVCTHIVDIDYGQLTLYTGNYDFWYESSQLLIKQMKEQNKKSEEKIKELQDFIARFSANASKSKQATSRKKALEKIEINEIKPSNRRYPYINFKVDKPLGTDVLKIENITKVIDGVKVLDNVSLVVGNDEKIAFVGTNEKAKTALFNILAGLDTDFEGSFKFGSTVKEGYFKKDHDEDFKKAISMTDWLTDYSPNKETTYVRGFLGRMLFSGDDSLKNLNVLSGGEKVRVSLAKMMVQSNNLLILDEPTNHLDMESITALNKGLIEFTGVLLFASKDHQLVQSTANKLVEITQDGQFKTYNISYDEYLEKQNN